MLGADEKGNDNVVQNTGSSQEECNLPNTDPKEIVLCGYNKVSYAYREADYDIASSQYKKWLPQLTSRLNKGDRILDLGCGCGVPVACILAEQFAVTGVDISPVQIERARELGLNAEFVCADMVELEMDDASFETRQSADVDHAGVVQVKPFKICQAHQAADIDHTGVV